MNQVGQQFSLSIILSIVSGLTQSIGIFLLFPLLETIDIMTPKNPANEISKVYDWFLNSAGLDKSLTLTLILFFSILTFRNVITRWQAILIPTIQLNYINQLRKQLYRSVVAVDWLYFSRQAPAHFTQILTSDVNRIGFGVTELNQLIAQVLLLSSYSIVALLIDWPITLWVTLCGLVAIFLQQRMAKRAYTLGYHQTQQEKNLYQWINDSFINLKLIKSSNKEQRAGRLFNQIVDANNEIYLNSNRHHADLNFYFQLYSAVTLVSLIYLSVYWLKLPSIHLLVLIFIFSRMMPLVSSIWQRFNRLKHMQAAYESYQKIYKQCQQHACAGSEQFQPPLKLESAISIEKLSFNYRPETLTNVLSEINLTIPAKQITALVGVSGSGKTTLCDLIAGLFKPSGGTIKIDAIELTEQSFTQWHNQTIYLTQDTLLFNESIRYNLCWYKSDATDRQLLQIIKLAELQEWFETLLMGLDTVIGERGILLSGGEKQRLALARALLAKPTLLILDEASSALDVLNEQKINRVIRQFRGQTTIILIAHRLSSIKISDKIIVLDQGRITEQDNWQTLSQNNQGLFNELLTHSDLNN